MLNAVPFSIWSCNSGERTVLLERLLSRFDDETAVCPGKSTSINTDRRPKEDCPMAEVLAALSLQLSQAEVEVAPLRSVSGYIWH